LAMSGSCPGVDGVSGKAIPETAIIEFNQFGRKR
jgi:hypothetical protein